MRLAKAFTMIELMLVVAIIAILAMIAVPVYKNYIDRARESSAQSTLQNIALAEIFMKAQPADQALAYVVHGSGHEDGLKRLAKFGFRPDPQVAFTVLKPTTVIDDAFVAYACFLARDTKVFVYDSVQNLSTEPYDPAKTYSAPMPSSMVAYHWDGSGTAGGTVTSLKTVTIGPNGTVIGVTP